MKLHIELATTLAGLVVCSPLADSLLDDDDFMTSLDGLTINLYFVQLDSNWISSNHILFSNLIQIFFFFYLFELIQFYSI